MTTLIRNSHPNDLALFEGQLLISCIRVGGHGQRVVVKEGHKDPEGLLGLRLIVVRWGAAIPVPVAILNTLKTNKKKYIILHYFYFCLRWNWRLCLCSTTKRTALYNVCHRSVMSKSIMFTQWCILAMLQRKSMRGFYSVLISLAWQMWFSCLAIFVHTCMHPQTHTRRHARCNFFLLSFSFCVWMCSERQNGEQDKPWCNTQTGSDTWTWHNTGNTQDTHATKSLTLKTKDIISYSMSSFTS